jgi:hypothetical protein
MDVTTDPLKMGMGGVTLMADAPSATIWGVIALPKRVVSVGVIDLIKYVAVQQVAPTCPQEMEFARHMVELEFAEFMDVQIVYFSPECAHIITKTQLFALQSMRMQWWGKMTSVIWRRN